VGRMTEGAMTRFNTLRALLAGGVSAAALATSAYAEDFNIPGGDLKAALGIYAKQARIALIYPEDEMANTHTKGASGDLSAEDALARVLSGTGFSARRTPYGAVAVVHDARAPEPPKVSEPAELRIAAASAASSVETVVVTSSKIKGDIQTVPIAITALSQEQLTSRQIAGGPDLVKEVPNLTFSKTNFTGYNIQIRGIGTQAISVTTDPAVAVAFNDIPFIRNHFFEQEFYDVNQVEVVRGPQGTLYGRNATAGVVNVISAKPTDQFEAMLSADWGNYTNRRYEGMVNIPLVDDRLDLRVAGEWTKRDGYTFDSSIGTPVDGRDLWSTRVTLGWKPVENLQVYAVWEHFQEDDDRVRSAKQLCKKDPGLTSIDGMPINNTTVPTYTGGGNPAGLNALYAQTWLSQGCLPTSFYSNDAFDTPNGQVIPFVAVGEFYYGGGAGVGGKLLNLIDPYAGQQQSHNLRVIQSLLKPAYHAKNDTLELNADYAITPSLTLTSQTGYNKDFLWSTEDFNRYNTAPGLFSNGFSIYGINLAPGGVYKDPQLGSSSAMVAQDLSRERAWQFSQEVRLASNFKGPFNFSLGANYMHYQTNEDYFVFFNVLSALTQLTNGSGPGDYTHCVPVSAHPPYPISSKPSFYNVFGTYGGFISQFGCVDTIFADIAPGTYIDPNPIPSLDGQGHNYFRSENPYQLSSYAGFGEAYYQLTPDIKLTAGLRWTDDQKTFWDIPSWVYMLGGGYPITGVVNQEWKEWTGRGVVNWTPKLDFTDQTLVYASYSRGYKGGGANPPLPMADFATSQSSTVHPPTFAPEFVNAYELGTKNTLLDGALTLNGDIFYYDYKGYQISKIVDRTAINDNFDAKIHGAELEASYEPIPGLKFNFTGGYEHTRVNNGQSSIDLMDRTDGNSDWVIVRPYIADTSNCILPAYVVKAILNANHNGNPPDVFGGDIGGACDAAYNPGGVIGVFGGNGRNQAIFSSVGFDPSTAPNNGEGIKKDISGNELPNAPHFTTALSADYTMPVSEDWAATVHTDFYWQSQSWARIWNDRPYDKLRGYSNVNLALILTSASGWQVMGYLKNVFDTTAITGAFLNSDDTALTTNVFVTDPRLFGVRVTKNW
jgi:iron complex outermembrane receptor protein